MMTKRLSTLFLLLALLCMGNTAMALTMKGKVYDRETKQPLAGVHITNTFTRQVFITDSTGDFKLTVSNGQMIEFRKMGYQIARVRIEGTNLPFYSIGMHAGPYELPEFTVRDHNFQIDSIETRETYQWAIDHYQLSGLDIVQHPFDALSKKNRQIWAFQKRFQYFEKQKFIDYVFNDDLTGKITGLKGDTLTLYKREYRPQYEQIQQWTTYEFYQYIKWSGTDFKRRYNID